MPPSTSKSPPSLASAEGPTQVVLPLTDAKVHVHTDGPLVMTCLTLSFRNTQHKEIEGALSCPLPPGAIVSAFSSTNPSTGHMQKGTIVKKMAGRVAFEGVVRNRGAHTSLCEATVSGFRTRIYPIKADGLITIMLTYLMLPARATLAALPLWSPISADMDGIPNHLLATLFKWLPIRDILRLATASRRFWHVADAMKVELPAWLADVGANTSIAINDSPPMPISTSTLSAPVIYAPSKSPARPQVSIGDDGYFVLHDLAEPPPPSLSNLTVQDEHIGLIWDTSNSRGREVAAFAAELTFLTMFVRALPASSTLALYGVSIDTSVLVPSRGVSPELIAEILVAVNDLAYVGGTDMSLLNDLVASHQRVTRWILFSDGISTLCSNFPHVPPGTPPISIVTAAAEKNVSWLEYLARTTHGVCIYLSLHGMSEQAGLDRLRVALRQGEPKFALTKVESSGAADILWDDCAITQPTHVAITGILRVAACDVTLHYGDGRVTFKKTYTLKKSTGESLASSSAAKYWAYRKAISLERGGKQYGIEEQISAIGKEFGIVTSQNSLVVLTTLEQFLAHGIVPPVESEFYHQFLQHQKAGVERIRTKEESSFARVAAMLASRAKPCIATIAGARLCTSARVQTSSDSDSDRKTARGGSTRGGPSTSDEDSDEPGPTRGGTRGGVRGGGGSSPESDTEQPHSPRTGKRGASSPEIDERPLQRQRADDAFTPFDTVTTTSPPESTLSLFSPRKDAIKLAAWDSNMPYLRDLTAAVDQWGGPSLGVIPEGVQIVLRGQFSEYKNSPDYFLDVADFLYKLSGGALNDWRRAAYRAATSILDLSVENVTYMRRAGYLLACHGPLGQARFVFEQVLALRPDEPQSYRDLALVLRSMVEKRMEAAAGSDPSTEDRAWIESLVRECVQLWLKVITGGPWHHRFNEIELTALVELKCFLAHMRDLEWLDRACYRAAESLPANMAQFSPSDLRVSMGWDTDMVDIDLHVVEPSGEEAYFGHPCTRIGGCLSRDFTQGYGPEEYMLASAPGGCYRVYASYFANHRQDNAGATSLLLSIFTNWGRPGKQRVRQMVIRLNKEKEGKVLCTEVDVPLRM